MKNKEKIYLEEINKEKFEVLYAVGFWNFTTLDYVSGISDELGVSYESVEEILNELEIKKLLTILRRDNKIFSAELTKNGSLMFHHPKYKKLKEELGY